MGNKNEGEQKPTGDAGGKSPGGKGKGGGYPAPASASGSKGGGKGEKTETYAEKKAREAEEQMKKQVDEFAAPADFADKAPASERLTKEEKAILEESATERAGTGTYDKFYPTQGYFACKKCGTPIYSYEAKFNSGCGWPAFDKCYEGAIKTVQEPDGRTEIRCDFCNYFFVGPL